MKFLTVVLLLFSNHCWSQSPIIGKWRCINVQPINSEPWSQGLIDYFLGTDNYKAFCANGLYAVSDRDKVSLGQWKHSGDDNRITITLSNGDINTFGIAKLSNDSMMLINWKKTTLTYTKDNLYGLDTLNQSPIDSSSVPATSKQICRKWIFKDTKLGADYSEQERLAITIVTNTYKSSWYVFKSDGSAISCFGNPVGLRWRFENDNRSIAIVDENGDGSLWNIKSISDTQLIIQKPLALTQLIFIPDTHK